MNPAAQLLLANKSWAQERRAIDPEFFARFTRGQRPQFLWISCSDSRLPANEITASDPGELFVHRNIANLVVHDDLNVLSVLQYAVDALEVGHVIVCGHHGCGGIAAALDGDPPGLLAAWLRPVVRLRDEHRAELDALPLARRWDRLVELNAVAQAERLVETAIVRDAWARARRPIVHAWVYSLEDGLLRPLAALTPEGPIAQT